MQQQMRYEAEYFDEKKRLLRAIFNETLAQCNDAFHRKNISKDKLQEMSLKCDDERYIRNMLDNPISIVLMGNRPCVKARIVNYMLGYELLPVFDSYDPDYNQSRRAVRILYGTQRRHAFCIKHFELLECSPLHTERVVSFEDLRLDIQNDLIGVGANFANGLAEGFNNLNLMNPTLDHNVSGLNEGIGGGSNTSSGLDSAGNEQSTTPTTLSLNSTCSLLKSAPFQTVANGPINNVPNGGRMANGVVSGAANQRIQSTNGNTIGNNNNHHRHCHSSGYSSQQNMTNVVAAVVNHNAVVNPVSATSGTGVAATPNVVNRGPNNSTVSNFLPPYNDDEEEDDDDDDYEMDEVLSQTDFVNEITTMEIILPHELLEKNLQIRVAPDVESFDLIYRTTFTRTSPIIIYCFERNDDRLTDTDQKHLAQLRQRMPSTPIFFAHIMDFEPIYSTCNGQYVQYQYHQTHQSSGSSQAPFLPLPYPYANTYRLSVDLPTMPSRITAKFSSKQTSTLMTTGNATNNEQATTNITAIIANNVDMIADKPCIGSPEFSLNQQIIVTNVANNDNGPIDAGNAEITMLKRSSSSSSCYSALSLSSAAATRKSYLEASEAIWKELKSLGFFSEMRSTLALQGPLDRRQKHQSNGYYMINERPFKCSKSNNGNGETGMDVSSRFICHSFEFCYFVDFFRSILKSNLVVASTLLNEIHNQYIQHYIFSAFEMTWNLNHCVPKRLEYARSKEAELYISLMGIANRKQDEIRQLIGETLHFIREDILEQAANYRFNNNHFNCNPIISPQEMKQCAEEIQDFVFVTLNRAIAIKLISSVDVMRESFIGTLERCLKQLEEYRQRKDLGGGSPGSRFHNRYALNDENKMVNKINQRFQEEKIDFALSRLLNLAYSIDINANSCNSMLRLFWERMKNFFLMFSVTWKPTCRIDADWKRKVSEDLLDNLSEVKLAKCICTQFREKLKLAHETFLNSLANLETIIISRLKDMDNRRQQVRKNDAPIFARLALESTSLIDAILYGTPELGKEIGRGQYGVVFSTKKSWGSYSRFAVKSIMICDDKHWNDLAMEFYYTRSLPEHERIVQIRGSIIEHNYNGASSYVYLIMDRMVRDLYAGLKAGLDWLQRLQIALDVVQGLRFLHNHGLIHRDIKLKNVLLDKYCRAKITDLGFCKSEVMISGSIVGTPIHMAPEVFTGKYDSMVDVYAFGILFWYICAGSVELPQIFEQCHNKDHLWIVVKKGLRPEKLDIFDNECFYLMEKCWAGDSAKRPLLGEVSETLIRIKARFEKKDLINSCLNDTNNNENEQKLSSISGKILLSNSKRSSIIPIPKRKSIVKEKISPPVPFVANEDNETIITQKKNVSTEPESNLTDENQETPTPLTAINIPPSPPTMATATV